jgi:hypothetical protein
VRLSGHYTETGLTAIYTVNFRPVETRGFTILGDFRKYSRVFRLYCVVARNTLRLQIFAFDTKFSRLGVGTKYLMLASRVETITR